MKITKNDLKNQYDYIVRAGYCEFQYLTKYTPKAKEIGHASGLYGWNWTAYRIEASNGADVVICTGYRDMTGERIEGLEKFEKQAEKISKEFYGMKDFDKKQKKLNKLATAFADYVIENYNKN